MEQMEQMEQSVLGNTKTKTDVKKSRKWCFTLNNYTENEFLSLKTKMEQMEHTLYIIGKEVGKNGTPHLQGFIQFKNPRNFNFLKKMNNRLHIEKSKGNIKQNMKYCSKDNNFITNYNMNLIIDKKKYLMDLEFKNITWKPFQQNILNIIKQNKPDNRKINWYYEENGNIGKSFLCKYISLNFDNVIISEGKKNDVYNQILTKMNDKDFDITKRLIIILDISRHNQDYINYGCIESIKNGCFYSGKYEGGQCIFPIPYVFIFSNEKPDYDKWSKDRYNVMNL